MRTTVDLDEDLMKKALAASKLPTKTALIEEGFRMILRREAGRELAAMGGKFPNAKGPRRRRTAAV
jgi:Arc/MetJ family transcription regulator